jgi:hypothetical protein
MGIRRHQERMKSEEYEVRRKDIGSFLLCGLCALCG